MNKIFPSKQKAVSRLRDLQWRYVSGFVIFPHKYDMQWMWIQWILPSNCVNLTWSLIFGCLKGLKSLKISVWLWNCYHSGGLWTGSWGFGVLEVKNSKISKRKIRSPKTQLYHKNPKIGSITQFPLLSRLKKSNLRHDQFNINRHLSSVIPRTLITQ
jgi:hypothetical protein